MRKFSQAVFAIALLHLASCGGDEDRGGSLSTMASFHLFKDGMNKPCSAVPGIERVEVNVYATDGVTKRPGYPRDADCSTSQATLAGLDGGSHVLEILAHGQVVGGTSAVLFKAKQQIDLPNSSIDLSLRPEVSFLTVAWDFQDEGPGVCANEVGEVHVFVSSSGGQGGSFNSRVPCSSSPLIVPMPLPVLNYTIRIDAYSFSDFQLYSATVQRVLERGDDEVSVTLLPLGSAVYLDWQFEVGSMSIRACDNERVSVAEIEVSIAVDGSSQMAMETVECTVDRPYAFRADRYQNSRTLEIDIVAEGAARFRGRRVIDTTGEDLYVPMIILEAVGTASAAFTVGTATCAAAQYDSFAVAAVNLTEAQLAVSFDLPADADMAVFEDLPYGEYEVVIIQQYRDAPVCAARGRGSIDDRVNAWPSLRL